MTGFKSGNTDLWDDDNEDQETEQETEAKEVDETPTMNTTSTQDDQQDSIPYITRRRSRGESTTWQRSRLTFYVREEVEDGERELKSEVESILGEEVSKFDLREAVYMMAQEHPEAVADKLEEMGVGYEL